MNILRKVRQTALIAGVVFSLLLGVFALSPATSYAQEPNTYSCGAYGEGTYGNDCQPQGGQPVTPGGGLGPLANTGQAVTWIVAIAAILIGSGTIILLTRRRKTHTLATK